MNNTTVCDSVGMALEDYEMESWIPLMKDVVSVLGIAGNVFYTIAMKYVSPSKANVFRSFEVILNFVLQITIEHGSFHLIALLGIACLLLAVVATGFENEAMRKWRARIKFL